MNANDYQTIRQLFDDYLRMYASRDDRLTTYFSKDFSGFTGGGDFLVKGQEEWVTITRQDFAQVKDPLRIELKDLAIQSLSDTIAVTTGFFTIHLPIKDHILSRETARLVLIFRKESTGWKITHSSISIPYYLVREGEIYPLKELTDRNQKLEDVIAERTMQLSEANDKLQQTNEELAKEIVERKRVEEALGSSLSLLSASLESTADGILIVDRKGKIARWNQKFADMWKIPEEVLSSSDDEKVINHILTQLADPEQFAAKVRKLYEQPKESSFDQIKFLDGRVFERYSQPQRVEDNIVGRVWSFRDITERKRMEEALRESEEQYRTLVVNASDIVFRLDNTGHITFVNPAALRIMGYEEKEIIGRHYPTFIRSDMQEEAMKFFGRQYVKGIPNTYSEYPVIVKDGQEIWLGQNTQLIFQDGKVIAFQAVARDITERKLAKEELRRNQHVSEQLAQEIAIIAEIGKVVGSTLDIEEVYENFAAEVRKLIPFDRLAVNLHNLHEENVRVAYFFGEAISGRSKGALFPLKGSISEILTKTRAGLFSHPKNVEEMDKHFPNHVATFQAGMRSLMGVPLIYRDEVIGSLHFRSKTPNAYNEQDLLLAERIGAQIAGAIANAQLFTDRKRMEEEIREMSLRDQMTDLYNRRGFITLTEQQIRAANRAKRPMLLTFIDLDGLKGINDTLGHEEGDRALIDAANVLRQTFRESDVITRLGGDEFAVLSIDAADMNPEDLSKRLQENIDACNAKETRPYRLAMSWGTVVYDPGSPLSLDELMSSADERMYAQKKAKSNRRI